MKVKQLLILIVILLLIQPNFLSAQSFKVKNYKMTVKGTSTLHEWESVVEKLECKASYKLEGNALADIREAVVTIPVESIKSPKGRMMDSKTYDAFNYEKYPSIIFTLTSQKINPTKLTVELKGTLAMAGATKAIDLVATYKVFPNGELLITGSKSLKMTEWKMEPPTAMMGTIKVGDEVNVNFEITLANTKTSL